MGLRAKVGMISLMTPMAGRIMMYTAGWGKKKSRVMRITGGPRMKMMLVAYCAQTKRGKRNQVMPGARIVCTVTIKFKPVRMEEKPLMNTPRTAGGTAELE